MVLDFQEIQAKRNQPQEKFCPCYYCQVLTGESYTKECDDKCEYASAIKTLNDVIKRNEEYAKRIHEKSEESLRLVKEIHEQSKENQKLIDSIDYEISRAKAILEED